MALILDGKAVTHNYKSSRGLEPLEVSDWTEHGCDMNHVKPTQRRLVEPSLVMLHWTAGENGCRGFAGTMRRRGLSISFLVDRAGRIFQFLDPVRRDGLDVGNKKSPTGRRSVSVEIANYGFPWPRSKGAPPKGRDRVVDRGERINGSRYDVARFYPEQCQAVAALCTALCDELGVQRDFPRDPRGRLVLKKLRGIGEFSGVCGHLHRTTKKADPGLWLFHWLDHEWNGAPFPDRYALPMEGRVA